MQMTMNSTAAAVVKGPAGNAYTYRISLVAAIGGLLFGYDTAIINGAIVFLKRQFGWTEFQTEIAASSLLLGCVLGVSLAGALSDWLGRRRLLLGSAILFAVSSLATAIPNTLGRVLRGPTLGRHRYRHGLHAGTALYRRDRSGCNPGAPGQSESTCHRQRDLISYLAGWLLSGLGDASWRWMFASAFVPSALFVIAMFFVPESPRWLAKEAREGEPRCSAEGG